MKKTVSFMLSFLIILLSFQITVYATNNIGANNFFVQVKELADRYDDSDGLSSDYEELKLTHRLIVKTKTNVPLDDYYGAVAVVEGYDCLHFLQYQNKVQAENAYISFTFDDVEYVEYDFYMPLGEEIGLSIADELNTHLSWNSSASQVDEAFELISEYGVECSNVNVAVMDSGIYAAHEFFNNDEVERVVDSGYIYKVEYTSEEDGSTYTVDYSSMEDDLYHGTHVSGIIYDNSMDNIKILPYRVTNERSILYSDILAAFESILIRNNIITPEEPQLANTNPNDDIDIVNMSFGGDLIKLDISGKTLNDKITLAVENGMIIVVAAGNESMNANICFPACNPNVITVSATDENGVPASFSNFGSPVDVAAPGVGIKSPTPRTFEDNNDKVVCEAYNTYMTLNGTSFSTPLATAAIAMMKSVLPEITPTEAKRIIKETAVVPQNWEENCDGLNYGTGILNFYNIAKALLEPEYSVTPTIKVNSDNKFEITAPEGTDSRIYYTLDGSVPTIDNHLLYTEPLNLRTKYVEEITAVCHENGKLIGEPVSYDLVTDKTKSVFYKWSINPLDDENSEILSCWTNNPEVATVDDYGKITGVSPGTAKITYNLASGERIIYRVNVAYAPWQWIIRILFFGFLWY